MGKVTRDFLIFYRLCPTQFSPNLFRVLGSVDILSREMGVNLSHHNVNWVYSCENRVPVVRLIFCLPKTNKGMDEDYLIILGD